MNRQTRFFACRAGFTLVELLLALTIIAILSAAVCALLTGALNTYRYLDSTDTTLSQVELAVNRMLHNTRDCSALDAPTTTTTQHAFTIETQPDQFNSLQSYNVVYALVGSQLIETDDRYGSSVICDNVTAFNVTLQSTTTPIALQITLTAGKNTQVTRSFKVVCRNL